MPALFWGFLAIVIVVIGLALIALRPQLPASDRPKDKGHGSGGMWWATDAGSGDCGDGGCD
ncbi:hypothetical protein [Novosphingobium jiangmenense]|uniref:Uncharacterized protein n=1 Tax=Novosphingobium jiangmenense TaxID=2791981 RepID=A0ABS0HG54_9SPHN|nr:hypothetical protein [Novosphingobium jiangmenense]MBF9151240.1 hypothetical protein [Novosphingobium jiangmenense]